MLRILSTSLALCLLVAGCHPSAGERCNPSQFADDPAQGDCDTGLACVYPTAPSCGVAFCCAVDDNGLVTDPHPSCRPDPALVSVCMLDLAAASVDAGTSD